MGKQNVAYTYNEIQTYLGDVAGSVLDHCNEMNIITVSEAQEIFVSRCI